ncbi:cyclic nucleotide-binding domain-containing protein [Cellulosilyticum ruminicola]|uniref:cyclic nucleotide-binding domain-containing protein n=1 Tax=Cellulosilyticum ruminicola TaxID=425254 RepID=UPI002E8E16DA|nr:cyclic nucleotide-binding domain-containing protein [Cellulosilyticum ruminicola]
MKVKGCSNCQRKLCASKVSIFENLDCEEFEKIVNKIKHYLFNKGEMIFNKEDVSDALCFVNTGKIKLYKYTRDGKEQILYVLSEGEFF